MKINDDKLPIKYVLGIEKDLPDYPTSFDILLAEVKLCVRMPDRHKGNFTLHALKTYRFPETSEEHLLNSIKELMELDLVKELNSDQGKESWSIITNPFG
jgi:hypothetical protein|tara:strand:+ start:203 stop:502 length:300 start_codon:yes stop_codon:yes gene_type:complete